MTRVFAGILRGFKWLLRYWYIPLIAIAAVAGWVFGSRKETPRDAVSDTLLAIRRREQVRKLHIKKGAELANAFANIQYHETVKRLDEEQRKKADALVDDPDKRIRYLRKLDRELRKRATDNRSGGG